MSQELKEAMREYEERFDDLFPLYCCRGMDDRDIIAEIRKCLQSGEPYEVDSEADY